MGGNLEGDKKSHPRQQITQTHHRAHSKTPWCHISRFRSMLYNVPRRPAVCGGLPCPHPLKISNTSTSPYAHSFGIRCPTRKYNCDGIQGSANVRPYSMSHWLRVLLPASCQNWAINQNLLLLVLGLHFPGNHQLNCIHPRLQKGRIYLVATNNTDISSFRKLSYQRPFVSRTTLFSSIETNDICEEKILNTDTTEVSQIAPGFNGKSPVYWEETISLILVQTTPGLRKMTE